MQRYLKDLKPTEFADLIAMNALYRPGPLEYIPAFVRRKHGQEPVKYDLDACEEYLAETYGITVYQEQVMLLSQKLAGFTKGEADTLRKAMGKKKADLIAKMKPKFLEGGGERGHDTDRARENLEGLGGLCQLRLQQVALHVLRLGGLSNGLPQGQPPGGIHGSRVVQQHVRHQEGDLLHGGMPAHGDRGLGARCERVRIQVCSECRGGHPFWLGRHERRGRRGGGFHSGVPRRGAVQEHF